MKFTMPKFSGGPNPEDYSHGHSMLTRYTECIIMMRPRKLQWHPWSSRTMPSIGGSKYKIFVSSKDCHKYALGKR